MYQLNPLVTEAKRIDLIKFANKNMSKRDVLNATKGFRHVTKTNFGPTSSHRVFKANRFTGKDFPYTLSDLLADGKENKITRAMINMGSRKV